MCMSSSPAKFSDTVIYAAQVLKGKEVVHVIGYQNNARSFAGPNAMILPIPAIAGTVGPQNIVDTREFSTILKSYGAAVERMRPRTRRLSLSKSSDDRITLGSRGAVQVFKSGSFTVVLAESPSHIREGLEQIEEKVRPAISDELIAGLSEMYPDWPIAVCCFDGAINPEPLLWWFKPRFAGVLFAPALDAHDGGKPDLLEEVRRDHTIAFGSYNSPRRVDTVLQHDIRDDVPSKHRWMFLPSVVGRIVSQHTLNGDFSIPISLFHDMLVESYLPRLDVTPPMREYPSLWDTLAEEA